MVSLNSWAAAGAEFLGEKFDGASSAARTDAIEDHPSTGRGCEQVILHGSNFPENGEVEVVNVI
jgi:hypothetical protein